MIDTSICDNKENEVRQSIEIKNAYKPFYLIEAFTQQNEKYYVYFNLQDLKGVTVYHKNNIDGSVDSILGDDGFVPIEHGIVVSTTKYDIFKIESTMRCEIEMAYIVNATEKTFKVNDIFIAVVNKNNPLTYTYTNVKNLDQYEFSLLNNGEVTITMRDSIEVLNMNPESNYQIFFFIGIADEESLMPLKIEATSEDGDVILRGTLMRLTSCKFLELSNATSVNITSQGNESYPNVAIDLPQGEYDTISVSIVNKGIYTNMIFSYDVYSTFESILVTHPLKKPTKTILSNEKYEFYIYNPYYMSAPEDVNTKHYTIGIHVDTNSTLDYEVNIEFITSDNQKLHKDNEIQIAQKGVYRLDNPYQQHEHMLIIVSRCMSTSSQVNLKLVNDGTKLKQIQSTNLMDYYLIHHKNYIYDLDVSINLEN